MKKNLLFGLLVLITTVSFGQKIPFQGKLIESGVPLNGTKTFEFSIDSPVWSETHTDVTVIDGLYFVVLGSINPLPDSLFYGVEEKQLSISVDGVALSPVTLFKPISSPFEGSELVVHNDDGTKVGEMKALSTEANKNGEVNVFGTNGSKNITLGALSHWQSPGNDFGWMHLSNDEGAAKAILGVTPYRGVHGTGEFTLRGETSSGIYHGFNSRDSIWDFPYLLMKSKLANGGNARIEIMKSDTTEFGELELSSNVGNQVLINPNSVSLNNNSGETLIKLRTDNGFGKLIINGDGNGAIRTPFNINSITGKHEFPGVTLFHNGNTYGNYYTTQNDSVVKGIMYLNSSIGESNISGPNSFYLVKDGKIMSQYRFHDWGDKGFSAYQRMDGPSSQNFEFGGKHWVNPDLPYFRMKGSQDQYALEMSVYDDSTETAYVNLNSLKGNSTGLRAGGVDYRGPNSKNVDMGSKSWENEDFGFINMWGSNDFHAMDISVSEDENGDQFGYINMMSQNGKSLHLSPEGFGVEGVGMNTQTNDQSENSGYLFTRGPSTTNFEAGGSWEEPDRAYLNLNGTTDENRLRLGIYEDVNQNEHGSIEVTSAIEKRAIIEHTQLTLFNTENNDWNSLASMSINNNNGSWVGAIDINGPSSGNIHLRSQQNPDLPIITLLGTDGFEAVQIGAVDDATQRGFIKMVNKQSGEEMFYSSHGVGGNTVFRIDGGSAISGGLDVTGFLTINGDTINPGVSDRRYKKNIQSLGENVLKKVELVEGVSYDWRKDKYPEKHFSSTKQIGVIAQELEAQFPELVKTNAEGYKSVNYNGFTAVLLEAVKELNSKVENLENENMQLKAQLVNSAGTKTELEQLKAQIEGLVKIVQANEQSKTATENVSLTSALK